MLNKKTASGKMPAAAAMLLSLALLHSCATVREAKTHDNPQADTDTATVFVPTHPPVVIPHSWRDSYKDTSDPKPDTSQSRDTR